MVNVTASYSTKYFLLKALVITKKLDSKIFYFWQVLDFIYKFITEFHTLQCLFVMEFNKKQRKVALFEISKNERLFTSYDKQVLLGVISKWSPTSCTLQKRPFLSPLFWSRRGNTWALKWKESFDLKIAWVFSIPIERVGIG